MADLFNYFHNKVQLEKNISSHYGTYLFILCVITTNIIFTGLTLYFKFQQIDKIGIPLTEGYISLQSEGHPVSFRNIKIKKL